MLVPVKSIPFRFTGRSWSDCSWKALDQTQSDASLPLAPPISLAQSWEHYVEGSPYTCSCCLHSLLPSMGHCDSCAFLMLDVHVNDAETCLSVSFTIRTKQQCHCLLPYIRQKIVHPPLAHFLPTGKLPTSPALSVCTESQNFGDMWAEIAAPSAGGCSEPVAKLLQHQFWWAHTFQAPWPRSSASLWCGVHWCQHVDVGVEAGKDERHQDKAQKMSSALQNIWNYNCKTDKNNWELMFIVCNYSKERENLYSLIVLPPSIKEWNV